MSLTEGAKQRFAIRHQAFGFSISLSLLRTVLRLLRTSQDFMDFIDLSQDVYRRSLYCFSWCYREKSIDHMIHRLYPRSLTYERVALFNLMARGGRKPPAGRSERSADHLRCLLLGGRITGASKPPRSGPAVCSRPSTPRRTKRRPGSRVNRTVQRITPSSRSASRMRVANSPNRSGGGMPASSWLSTSRLIA